jgi:translation initiation factor 2 beta subunit (eIF-2beta)/eIF-5
MVHVSLRRNYDDVLKSINKKKKNIQNSFLQICSICSFYLETKDIKKQFKIETKGNLICLGQITRDVLQKVVVDHRELYNYTDFTFNELLEFLLFD